MGVQDITMIPQWRQTNIFKHNIYFFKCSSGYYVSDNWGLSFIVPGLLIAGGGLLIWLFMIVKPEDVGIDLATLENQDAQADSDNAGIVS